jgi:hypothetical protein
MILAVDIWQARQVSQTGGVSIDGFSPSPYRLGNSMIGKIRGLLDIKNWSAMSLAKAAQAVQISAFPDAYQKWELSAWSWFDLIESETNND